MPLLLLVAEPTPDHKWQPSRFSEQICVVGGSVVTAANLWTAADHPIFPSPDSLAHLVRSTSTPSGVASMDDEEEDDEFHWCTKCINTLYVTQMTRMRSADDLTRCDTHCRIFGK